MILERLKRLNQLTENVVCTRDGKEISLNGAFDEIYRLLKISSMNYVIGNGGSAGIASHFATDLLKALKLPAATLTDAGIMTCISNDYGYDRVFSEPLKLLLKEENILFAISSSGKSQNILNAVQVAKTKDSRVVTLSGFSQENPLRSLGDINFWINADDYGFVEMAHFCLLHTLTDLWTLKKVLSYAHQS